MLAVLNALQRFPQCNEWSDGVWSDSLLPGNMVFCQHLHYIVSTITIFQSHCFLFISEIHPFNSSCVRIYHRATTSSTLVLSCLFSFADHLQLSCKVKKIIFSYVLSEELKVDISETQQPLSQDTVMQLAM